jgi:2-iminobutanoate/2-iminopropanoate deaminase
MEKISTDKAPAAAGPYSQAVASGELVFVSGQIPVDPATGKMPESMADQAKQALENLKSVVEASGSSMNRVLRTTIYLTDMDAFPEVNAVYAEFFRKPYPSRSCVGCASLPKGSKIEIDAVALR